MELLKFCMVLLVVLSVCEGVPLPSCKWTLRLKPLNEKSNKLLQNMGDLMPLNCLGNRERSFPDDVFIKAQNEDLVLVSLETLRGVATIFKNDQTSVTWDREKLGLFNEIVTRQVENLEECVGKEVQTVTDKLVDSSTATLRSYFKNLEEQLKEKEFSLCGWEQVRNELQNGLEQFQTFLESKIQ